MEKNAELAFFRKLVFLQNNRSLRVPFLKHHNWVVSSSDRYPLVCLKNGLNNICPKPKIDRLLSRLFTFIWQDKKSGSPRDFGSYL